jgi:hypothetical protein
MITVLKDPEKGVLFKRVPQLGRIQVIFMMI